MTLTYSTRFSRRDATRPGLGSAAATRSSACSSDVTKVSISARAGRGRPSGGICPVRSLWTTFSRTGAWAAACVGSTSSRASPPVSSRWLWQVTQ